jgi:hypothetical protein
MTPVPALLPVPPAPGAESGAPAPISAGADVFAATSTTPALDVPPSGEHGTAQVGGPPSGEYGAAPAGVPVQVETSPVLPAALDTGGQPDAPSELPALPESALVPAAAAPLVEPRPVSGMGGLLSALISRLLGGTPEPPAPTAGPAPLDMPWARRATPPTDAGQDSPAGYETTPPPMTVQRAVAAPAAPSAAGADVAAASPTPPAPFLAPGSSLAMPAVPAPGGLPGAPEAPAWAGTPAAAFDPFAAEMDEAPAGPPWMDSDSDSMAGVLARVQTPLVPVTALSTAGQEGLWSRIWGAFERALPGAAASGWEHAAPPATPLAYAWSAGSPATPGATGGPSAPERMETYSGQPGVIFGPATLGATGGTPVPARIGDYSGQPRVMFGPSATSGPAPVAWTPPAGLGGRAPLARRSLADFVPALGAPWLNADPAQAAAPDRHAP